MIWNFQTTLKETTKICPALLEAQKLLINSYFLSVEIIIVLLE